MVVYYSIGSCCELNIQLHHLLSGTKYKHFMFQRLHLNNYFRLHVCLSFRTSVCPSSVCLYVTLPFFPFPAVVSHNFTIESCLACVKIEKYVVWVILRPLGPWGEAMLCILKLISVFYHLHRICPEQLCALAHLGYTCKAGSSWLIYNFNFDALGVTNISYLTST